jgi:hypothetical protein
MFAILLTLVLPTNADPVPPCPAPFPASAVSETWCSTVLAHSPTGVTVAQYGVPASETLVTATTNASIWYDSALFFLGGGIETIFSYLGGANAAGEKLLADGRTVPIAIRSPLTSASGQWETSMMISTARYPDASKLPAPLPNTHTALEPLGARTFATLDFDTPPCPPIFVPPYFTAFQRCDAMLAAGLPAGWALKAGSPWTPAWLIYNARDYNGTWTSRCLAEVESAGGATPPPPPPPPPPPASLALPTPAPLAALAPAVPRTLRGGADAPPICAVMLEFETVYWGAWAPPHAPNTAINIDGGSDGQTAKDDANGVIVLATSTDTPFFGLRLAAITLATGTVKTIGNNWPSAPPGFSGANGLFYAVEFHPVFNFVVLLTEISRLGPVPTRAAEPGTPLGWTVAATVDVQTGGSTARTPDLTPALAAFPPLADGLSALDGARSTLWLLSAEDGAQPLGPGGCEEAAVRRSPRRQRASRRRPAAAGAALLPPCPTSSNSSAAFFLGVPLASAPPPIAAPPAAVAALGGGFIVTAFEFAAVVDSIVALEFNAAAAGVTPPFWRPAPARVTLYPVNGSSPVVLGAVPGAVSPSVGSSQVSADGRFVYFGADQGPNQFESAALIIVDAQARTVSLTLAAPSDDYDVFNLYRC